MGAPVFGGSPSLATLGVIGDAPQGVREACPWQLMPPSLVGSLSFPLHACTSEPDLARSWRETRHQRCAPHSRQIPSLIAQCCEDSIPHDLVIAHVPRPGLMAFFFFFGMVPRRVRRETPQGKLGKPMPSPKRHWNEMFLAVIKRIHGSAFCRPGKGSGGRAQRQRLVSCSLPRNTAF